MEDIEKTRVSRRLGDCFSIDHNLEDDILAVSFDAGEMERSCSWLAKNLSRAKRPRWLSGIIALVAMICILCP